MARRPDAPRQSPIVPPGLEPALTYETVGPPPTDSLAAADWMFRVLIAAADEVRRDGQRPARDKLRDLLAIAGEMRALVPKARIYKAESIVLGDEAKAREQGLGGPELTDAAQVDSDGRRPAARRGRPPRKSMR
jgi:hypothetical protein